VRLAGLARAGAGLVYHGDFDWGGVHIANGVMRRHGAVPWRFSTADYLAREGGTPLRGRPAPAIWDPALAPAMQRRARRLHEEQVIDDLIADLAGPRPAGPPGSVPEMR
jgi:uncharacterized protein (TIGR02679 family)